MITTFKIYEKLKDYNVGDYIFIDIMFYKNFDTKHLKDCYIDSEFNNNKYIVPALITHKLEYVMDYPYLVELLDDKFSPAISKNDIKRKLSEEEIRLFNAKKLGLKYNL